MKRSKRKLKIRIEQWLETAKNFFVNRAFAGRIPTTELVNRVFNFCELYSGRTLFPYQEQFSKRVIRSILTNDGAEITALFSRQSGKSETIAVTVGGMMIILPTLANMPMFADDPRLEMFKDGLWVGIFAPSQRQAQITYGRMKARLQCKTARAVLEDDDFRLQFSTSNGQTVALTNGSFATAISASDGSNIEGESFKVIICEECFVRGTPILTEKGYVNIEDVKVGDKVYSFNHGTNKVELKTVQRSFSQPLYGRKIVTIKTESGREITCTDNHKIFISEIGYVRADSLQINDDDSLQTEKDPYMLKGMSKDSQHGVYEELLQEEKIVSIEIKEVAEIEVFDLTVEDNHNFFANGLLVHNCQDISNFKIQKAIHPMGAAYNASIIKIGTATTHKGDFYDAIQRNKKDAEIKSTHIKNHFEYDYTIAAKYNPKYARYVEGEKKKLGENSDAFRMSYKLEWIIERGMFIDIATFERNNTEPLLERTLSDMQSTHVVGIDIGGVNDDTVVTVCEVDWNMPVIMESRTDEETGEDINYLAYNAYVVDWLRISNEPDYEEQYPIIMDYLSHFKIARVVCDATREAAVAHRLRANLNCEVIPYVFSSKSKSDLYKHLEKEIVTGRARICAGEETQKTVEYQMFLEQMADLQKGYSGAYLVVSHPDERGAHDDFPDSFALAVWGCSFAGEVNYTETKGNPFVKKTLNELKRSKRRNSLTGRRR